jgi:predicted DNA-binding transcriptional regulator YafY
MKQILHRLIKLDYLIRLKATGRPAECAQRIGISERALYNYIGLLKNFGAPIAYSRSRSSYYYLNEGHFKIAFQEH